MYFTEEQMNYLHHELTTLQMALFGSQCYNFLLPAVWKLHVHHWRQVPWCSFCCYFWNSGGKSGVQCYPWEMSWSDQILISNEFKHFSKSILNAAQSVHSTLHFPPYYNGDDTCFQRWIYADSPRGQWCTNRDVFNWKDMCSSYGCGHGCLVSEWVHIALLQKRTCAKYFFRLIFSCYK